LNRSQINWNILGENGSTLIRPVFKKKIDILIDMLIKKENPSKKKSENYDILNRYIMSYQVSNNIGLNLFSDLPP
jgi:hypothetical protein